MDSLAPIALFVYNRPRHTRLTIEALLKNSLASESELYVFSDGAKHEAHASDVAVVREYLKGVVGFKNVTIIERPKNIGLARSIVSGVTDVVRTHGRVIVLEDDLVTSPYFLQYMCDALRMYEHDERVVSIHGYVYPVTGELPETFFIRGADCWGWATWQRGWEVFRPDASVLLEELQARKLTRSFDYNGSYPYTDMLRGRVLGFNNSWAILWHASAFLANKLTLYPGKTLVSNIGFDNTGTHSGRTNYFETRVSEQPVQLVRIPVVESTTAVQLFMNYFNSRIMTMAKVSMKIKFHFRRFMSVGKMR